MPVKIFFCYAHEDEGLLNKLKAHLRPLQRQGLIAVWHDRNISAGAQWEQEISQQLNEADIILLLVSPDFLNSDYCYSIEMKQGLERHDRGVARVIPLILRPVYWQDPPLGKLQALPRDGKPVTDPTWYDLDRAFLNVTEGIRKIVMEMLSPSAFVASEEMKKEEERTHAVNNAQIIAPTISYKFKKNKQDYEYELQLSLSQNHVLKLTFYYGFITDIFILSVDGEQIIKKESLIGTMKHDFLIEDKSFSLYANDAAKLEMKLEGETVFKKERNEQTEQNS